MRILRWLLICGCVSYSWYHFGYQGRTMKDFVEQYLESGEFSTLEAKYTAEEVMENHKTTLLKTPEHSFLKPELEFHPFLLMEVKFTDSSKRTTEANCLWSYRSGEMLVDTENWESSHGFADCIQAGATPDDYRIINALSKKGGSATKDGLMKELQVEADVLDKWLASVRDKHLVVQFGSEFRLHFQNPKIQLKPQTAIRQRWVSKPFKHAVRVGRRYSRRQLESNAEAAFGKRFAIRSFRDVYVPVYAIEVKNPDGSIHTSHWNALSGKMLEDTL